jgi:hypothetical protein
MTNDKVLVSRRLDNAMRPAGAGSLTDVLFEPNPGKAYQFLGLSEGNCMGTITGFVRRSVFLAHITFLSTAGALAVPEPTCAIAPLSTGLR